MNLNPNYRPDIDGLRAVAVLAVVLNHLSASLVPGGYVGVDVFFVISGYLITRIISREMEKGSFTFSRFYERRARRIFPALFAVLTTTLVIGYFLLLPSDYTATLRSALGTLFFSSNFVFWRDMRAGYFAATDAGLSPLLHSWSLAVEEQFYLFFPILLLLCFRYARRHIVLILVVCTLVSLAGAAFLVQRKGVAVFFLSPFRAWELLFGALLAFNTVPLIKSRPARELAAGSGLLAIFAGCFLYDSKTTFPGLAALAPVLGAAALIHVGSSGSSLVGRLLHWRPVVYIGEISYSLYLWHWPLIVLTRYAIGMEPLTPDMLLALFVVSLACGSLSYHFIEQPFRRDTQITRKVVYSSSAVFASLLALASIIGVMNGGFAGRFSPEVVRLDEARVPPIPFLNCDGRPIEIGCRLGRPSGKPTVLLWGDSHLLAWGPALDISLASRDMRAVFATTSSCPPLLGVNHTVVAICSVQNRSIKNYLLANPDIKTVVMAAYWGTYFREGGPLIAQTGSPPVEGVAAAKSALASTIQWLRESGRQVVLIGPVPVYEKSVPLALALGAASGRQLLHSSGEEQRKKNTSFFEVADTEHGRDGASFRFLDPIQWLCTDGCIIIKDGRPLYRDPQHLSVAGAMAMEANLRNGLTIAPVEHH